MNNREMILHVVKKAKDSDLEALKILIKLVRFETDKKRPDQKLILRNLADIFFHSSTTKTEKQMIWELRDTPVEEFIYSDLIDPSHYDTETGEWIKEESYWVEKEGSRTFLDYLWKYRSNDMHKITGGKYEVFEHSNGMIYASLKFKQKE